MTINSSSILTRPGTKICLVALIVLHSVFCHVSRVQRQKLVTPDGFAYRHTFNNHRIHFRDDASPLSKFVIIAVFVVLVCYVVQKLIDLRRSFTETLNSYCRIFPFGMAAATAKASTFEPSSYSTKEEEEGGGNQNDGTGMLSALSSNSLFAPFVDMFEKAVEFIDTVITEDGMLDLNKVADAILCPLSVIGAVPPHHLDVHVSLDRCHIQEENQSDSGGGR